MRCESKPRFGEVAELRRYCIDLRLDRLLRFPVLACFNVVESERTRYKINSRGRGLMYQNCDINQTFTPCAYF